LGEAEEVDEVKEVDDEEEAGLKDLRCDAALAREEKTSGLKP
jgi:hypothetical protein